MAISTEIRRAGPYKGDGAQRDFPFDFKVFEKDDIVVRLSTDNGETERTMSTSDFDVELNSDQDSSAGGVVRLVTPLAKGSSMAILSGVDYLQTMVLTNRGGFFPSVINGAFDKATAQIQQLLEGVNRSIKAPATSTLTSEQFTSSLFKARDIAVSASESAQSANAEAGQHARDAHQSKEDARRSADLASADAARAQVHANNARASDEHATAMAGAAEGYRDQVERVAQDVRNDGETIRQAKEEVLATADAVRPVLEHLPEVNLVADNLEPIKATADNVAQIQSIAADMAGGQCYPVKQSAGNLSEPVDQRCEPGGVLKAIFDKLALVEEVAKGIMSGFLATIKVDADRAKASEDSARESAKTALEAKNTSVSAEKATALALTNATRSAASASASATNASQSASTATTKANEASASATKAEEHALRSSYSIRFSKVKLTPNSATSRSSFVPDTNAKVGDTIVDVSGGLHQITAVTASTITVGERLTSIDHPTAWGDVTSKPAYFKANGISMGGLT